jgi:hypothetical protein
VFQNRVLRRIFGPKRDEVTRFWRNCTMQFTVSNYWMINSRSRRFGRANSMYGEKRNMHTIVVGKPDGKRLPVRLGISGKMILKWILRK